MDGSPWCLPVYLIQSLLLIFPIQRYLDYPPWPDSSLFFPIFSSLYVPIMVLLATSKFLSYLAVIIHSVQCTWLHSEHLAQEPYLYWLLFCSQSFLTNATGTKLFDEWVRERTDQTKWSGHHRKLSRCLKQMLTTIIWIWCYTSK